MSAKEGTTVALTRNKGKAKEGLSSRACLIILQGQNVGNRFFLEDTEGVLGRAETAQLRIEDESVSRRHARLVKNPGGKWSIQDLNSTNGTWVNGERVKERILKDGDLIQVGKTALKFLSGGHIEHRYYEEIYRLTHLDALTQAYNQQVFFRTLEQELNRCRRYLHPLSMAMIDLDHFKKVNDRYGHLAGDHLLKEISALIRRQIRRTDFFARYGGEEFALILPETDRHQARQICEKLRSRIASQAFSVGDQTIRITVSIGLATVDGGKMVPTPQAFIAAADAKLYEAKRNRRNRVCD